MHTPPRDTSRIRIVVGFDGSEAAIRALGRAAEEIAPGGTLTLVSVEPTAHSAGILSRISSALPRTPPGCSPWRSLRSACRRTSPSSR